MDLKALHLYRKFICIFLACYMLVLGIRVAGTQEDSFFTFSKEGTNLIILSFFLIKFQMKSWEFLEFRGSRCNICSCLICFITYIYLIFPLPCKDLLCKIVFLTILPQAIKSNKEIFCLLLTCLCQRTIVLPVPLTL